MERLHCETIAQAIVVHPLTRQLEVCEPSATLTRPILSPRALISLDCMVV